MSEKFLLYTQFPTPKDKGMGVLSVDTNGVAQFFSGDGGKDTKILAELVRVRLEIAAAKGIRLSGMEPKTIDRVGRRMYDYQEWWLQYAD